MNLKWKKTRTSHTNWTGIIWRPFVIFNQGLLKIHMVDFGYKEVLQC